MDEGLLIVGIDPGITAAYAALNTKGELIKLKSGKHLNLNTILQEITQAGKVIAVGTDVKHSPKFVEKFCSRLNARLIPPKEDMKIGFKKRYTQSFRCDNDHQRDALAGALYAYRELEPLLKKINVFLKKEGKEHLKYDTTILAVRGMAIKDAVNSLEKKEEGRKTKKRIREKIKRSANIVEYNKMLQRENQRLKEETKREGAKLRHLSQNMERVMEEKIKKVVGIKNRRLHEMDILTQTQSREIADLKEKIRDLHRLLLSAKDNVVIKRLKTLGWEEVQTALDEQDDAIFVDNPSIFSQRSLVFIRDHIKTLICSNKPPFAVLQQPFTIINRKDLDLEERERFVVVKKRSLEREKEKSLVLHKIVQQYREERQAVL